jgi:hypothetical protein
MVGLILEGTFAKDNTYLVLGGSGMAGFVGQQKSLALSYKLLTLFVNSSSEETKPKKRNKTRTKKKNDDNQP